MKLELFRADVAPQRAGAQPVAGAGPLFGDGLAAVAATAELLPGETNLDAFDAQHGVIGLFGPAHRGAPIRYVGNPSHADCAAANCAVDAFEAEGAPAQRLRHVAPVDLTSRNRRRRRRECDG